eukprot:TRINITY_DN7597_c0_g1_i5.p1 TRINITY_DN7597_c0_g1~~TRINITY_DN7597_c0_g1_i5.p1  ORF type:complete len:1123 (-),score=223.23 TRINITY_DN7597_c0_g1_i5:742-4110(-)
MASTADASKAEAPRPHLLKGNAGAASNESPEEATEAKPAVEAVAEQGARGMGDVGNAGDVQADSQRRRVAHTTTNAAIKSWSELICLGLMLVACFYFFIVGLGLMGDAFGVLRGYLARTEMFVGIGHFVAWLTVGFLVTVIIPSAFLCTCVVFFLVGIGRLSVQAAIPIVMGGHCGSSVAITWLLDDGDDWHLDGGIVYLIISVTLLLIGVPVFLVNALYYAVGICAYAVGICVVLHTICIVPLLCAPVFAIWCFMGWLVLEVLLLILFYFLLSIAKSGIVMYLFLPKKSQGRPDTFHDRGMSIIVFEIIVFMIVNDISNCLDYADTYIMVAAGPLVRSLKQGIVETGPRWRYEHGEIVPKPARRRDDRRQQHKAHEASAKKAWRAAAEREAVAKYWTMDEIKELALKAQTSVILKKFRRGFRLLEKKNEAATKNSREEERKACIIEAYRKGQASKQAAYKTRRIRKRKVKKAPKAAPRDGAVQQQIRLLERRRTNTVGKKIRPFERLAIAIRDHVLEGLKVWQVWINLDDLGTEVYTERNWCIRGLYTTCLQSAPASSAEEPGQWRMVEKRGNKDDPREGIPSSSGEEVGRPRTHGEYLRELWRFYDDVEGIRQWEQEVLALIDGGDNDVHLRYSRPHKVDIHLHKSKGKAREEQKRKKKQEAAAKKAVKKSQQDEAVADEKKAPKVKDQAQKEAQRKDQQQAAKKPKNHKKSKKAERASEAKDAAREAEEDLWAEQQPELWARKEAERHSVEESEEERLQDDEEQEPAEELSELAMQSSSSNATQNRAGTETKVKVLHQLSKTTLCNFFAAGSCPNGADCKFAHGTQELQSKPNFCKTSICKAWKAGKCKKTAAKCQFAHGYSDIRTTSGFDGKSGGAAEDQRKKRSEVSRRHAEKSKPSAGGEGPCAEESTDHQHLLVAPEPRPAESQKPEESPSPSASTVSSLRPRSKSSDSVNDSVAVSWATPLGSKVRWADLSDDDMSDSEQPEVPRSYSALSQVSTAWSSCGSEASSVATASSGVQDEVQAFTDAAHSQLSQTRQPCVLNINNMLTAERTSADSTTTQTPPCFGGMQQQHRIVMVPVLVPEQYFMAPAFSTAAPAAAFDVMSQHDNMLPAGGLEA